MKEIKQFLSQGERKADFCISKAAPLLDEKGEKSGWYRQVVAKVDAVNSNARYYPRRVYEEALGVLKEEGFPYAGEHPHPDSYIGIDGQIYFKTSVPNACVRFRDAEIDADGNVWAEYRVIHTEMGKQLQELIDNGLPIGFSNRMAGETVQEKINGEVIDVASKLRLFCWDVVLNPSEETAFSQPSALTDTNMNKQEDKRMDFFGMKLEELQRRKETAESEEEQVLLEKIIALKQELQKVQEKQKKALGEEKQEQDGEDTKGQEDAQAYLQEEAEKLPYDRKTKEMLKKQGKKVQSKKEADAFLDAQQALLDSVAIHSRMEALGISPKEGQKRAYTMTESREEKAIVDNLMQEMDRELLKKNAGFKIDQKLRKANRCIVDQVLWQFEREGGTEYRDFCRALVDQSGTGGSAVSDTGKFAQSAGISLAILYQAWQDVKFLQLCLTEGFSGSTYKMPLEFQSHDLFSEEDFLVGEMETIPTESIQTFLLEFGASWLKRGFIVSKEAEQELKSGPMRYDVIAGNAANIAMRFSRAIDKMISTEMLARADEYQAVQVNAEAVDAAEFAAVTPGVNAPNSTNAAFVAQLLCGNTSPLSRKVLPPVVRPRISTWLDPSGKKQQGTAHPLVVKDAGGNELVAGQWISSRGVIQNIGGRQAQYAVDYENARIYFVSGVVSTSNLPTASYSYATNLSYFNLAVPASMQEFSARYYNQILELIDREKAYMGSAPRFVTPDFVLGSLSAMTFVKQAELFYQRALPEGTSLFGGELYFGKRNGLEFCEHNTPWAAGDGRLLLGKQNAVRVGMGSPYELEGPYPHIAAGGVGYTSAKEYFATQQVAVNTPLVIDENGTQYHPPFRSIKFYQAI